MDSVGRHSQFVHSVCGNLHRRRAEAVAADEGGGGAAWTNGHCECQTGTFEERIPHAGNIDRRIHSSSAAVTGRPFGPIPPLCSCFHFRNDLPQGLSAFYFNLSVSGLVPKMVKRREDVGGRGQSDLSEDVLSVSTWPDRCILR